VVDAYTDHDDYVDDYDDDDRMTEIVDTEWQEGKCDHCPGGDADGVTATGPLGPLHCACKIGQGAANPEDCQCGPEDER
jgi:hypothetical protein